MTTDQCECDRDQLAAELLPQALRFVGIVRDEGTDATAQAYAEIPAAHRDAFAVILAALVPTDCTATSLLSWLEPSDRGQLQGLPYTDSEDEWTESQLRTAYALRRRGIRDLRVVAGYRIYERKRARERATEKRQAHGSVAS